MQKRSLTPAIVTPSKGNLLDFLDWVAARPRTYAEAMDAWRTSCPRLSAWEDAITDDLVRVEQGSGLRQGKAVVLLTLKGAAFLSEARPAPPPDVPSQGIHAR